jgi:phosphoserine phosphatase RsbU/P
MANNHPNHPNHQKIGTRLRDWFARRSKLARLSLRLIALIIGLLLIGRTSGTAGAITIIPIVVCVLVLVPLLLVLTYRWVSGRVLWRVRNRLILTYLLMGLAPVVLFGTLTGIAAYLLAGQYATNTELSQLDQASTEVRNEAAGAAIYSLLNGARLDLPTGRAMRPEHWGGADISLAQLKNGKWSPLAEMDADPKVAPSPFLGQPRPSWLQNGFHGIVAYDKDLYLCAMISVTDADKAVPVLATRPLNRRTLSTLAEGLGRVTLVPGFTRLRGDTENPDEEDPTNVGTVDEDHRFALIRAGILPPRSHFVDPPVLFSAPLPIYSWRTGKTGDALVAVLSRPGLLYTHLFATSVSIGAAVRDGLIAIGIVFGLIEMLALLMAAGLARTITRAISELYHGTREIDEGHLEHRVEVARQDQLGALATSFNKMADSIIDLLEQQREKERLLSELAIAQEVQTNLFPKSPVTVDQLELHAICIPARTVSGDYFDFIFGRSNTGLCLALGDISGKGISAALLMASLHSAVRAFGLSTSNGNAANGHSERPSPALLLKLINRHLYSSTTPEKYATLFLAYYDGESRQLTYSNGGHLPPVVISTDGRIQELTCGGPVVGLLAGLEYEEATVELRPGDLLMAYTDGLTEPENEFGEFGEQRLVNFVQKHSRQALPSIADTTMKELQQWIGNHEQPDDMTILLARQL